MLHVHVSDGVASVWWVIPRSPPLSSARRMQIETGVLDQVGGCRLLLGGPARLVVVLVAAQLA